MCLAVPMKIKKRQGDFSLAESAGVLRRINTQMISNLKEGDYVVVHAGFAIEKLDPHKARQNLRLIDEIY